MVKLSPSALKLLRECPRCFWLHHVKGIRRPEVVFPTLPSGMDRVLKAHFDAYRDKGALPPELRELSGVKLFDDVELLKVWTNNRKGIAWTDSSGNTLRGAIDYLLVKGPKLIVLDFKTRGYPLKEDTPDPYQDQLDIYNFLLRKNGYATEDYSYMLFYYPESIDSHGHVKFHADLVKLDVSVKNAASLFAKALEALAGREPKPAEECGFCAWAKDAA